MFTRLFSFYIHNFFFFWIYNTLMVAFHQAANLILQSHGCFCINISCFLIHLWLHSILWASWSNTVVWRGFYFISVPANRYKQAFLEIFFFHFLYGWWNHRTQKNVNDVPMVCFKCCASSVYIYIYRLISPMAKSLQISKLKIKNKDYYSSIVTTYRIHSFTCKKSHIFSVITICFY